MITDDDIVRALEGELSPEAQLAREIVTDALEGKSAEASQRADRVVTALHDRPSQIRQAQDDRIVEALTGEPVKPTPRAGELQLQERGAGHDVVKDWAAKGKADAVVKDLAEALMRADKTKGIFTAESEARAAATQAYEHAATISPYEDERQEAVALMVSKVVKSLAS